MDIDAAIEKILEGIPSGYYFDSHLVTGQLNEHHSELYNSYIDNFCNDDASKNEKDLAANRQIGRKVKNRNDLVERQEGKQSWSKNIHGKLGECALWLRK